MTSEPTQEGAVARLIVPATPSRARLIIFSLLLALWILILVLLYFRTVRPIRQTPLPTRAVATAAFDAASRSL